MTLLERVFLSERLAPWHSNRLSRLVKTPKLHLADGAGRRPALPLVGEPSREDVLGRLGELPPIELDPPPAEELRDERQRR